MQEMKVMVGWREGMGGCGGGGEETVRERIFESTGNSLIVKRI